MIPQSYRQKSKCQVRRKRKDISPLGIDSEVERLHRSYTTRSSSKQEMPISDQCQDVAEKANRNKSLKIKTGVALVRQKSAKRLRLSPNNGETSEQFAAVPPQMNQAQSAESGDDEKGECGICHEQFDNPHEFTIHLRKHHSGKLTCRICNQTLSSTSSLDRHILTHSKERPYSCKYCTQSFTTNGNMHRHMHKHNARGTGNVDSPTTVEGSSDLSSQSGGIKENGHATAVDEAEPQIEVSQETAVDEAEPQMEVSQETAVDEAEPRMEVSQETPTLDQSNSSPAEKVDKGKSAAEKGNSAPAKKADKGNSTPAEKADKGNSAPAEKEDKGDSAPAEKVDKGNSAPAEKEDKSIADIPKKFKYKSEIGYAHLSYMPFSSKKFSVVAQKAYENVRLPGNMNLYYKCKICDTAFPDIVSLRRHKKFRHNGSETYCIFCNVSFKNRATCWHHNLKYHPYSDEWYCNKGLTQGYEMDPKEKFFHKLGLFKKEKNPSLEQVEEAESEELSSSSEEMKGTHQYSLHTRDGIDYVAKTMFDGSGTQASHHTYGNTEENTLILNKAIMSQEFKVTKEKSDESAIPKGGDENICTAEMSIVPSSEREAENGNDFADINSILSNVSVTPVASEQSVTDRNAPSSSEMQDSKNDSSPGKETKDDGAHNKITQNKNRPVHPCSVPDCSYKSSDKSSVARHLRTHTKEHPFVCLVCSCKFTTKANGERHAKKIHKLEPPETNMTIAYNDLPNADMPQVCKYCGVDFYNSRVLQHHYRSLNNSCSKKPFFCAKCRQGFVSKNNFKRHYRNKHHDTNLPCDAMKNFCMQKTGLRKRKRREGGALQNINTYSSEASDSSVPSQDEKRFTFSDDDRVDAAESLVSLSQSTELHPFPLDLSVHPLDLSANKSRSSEERNKSYPSVPSSNFPTAPDSGRMPRNGGFSSNYLAPLDLTYNPPSSHPFSDALLPQALSLAAAFQTAIAPVRHAPSPSNSAQDDNHPNRKTKMASGNRVKCEYCESDFSLKTNKERHVKNKHPEQLRAESKNSAHPKQSNKTPAQIPSAILNTTKKAIVCRVLQNTANNKQLLESDNGSNDQLQNKSLVRNENLHEIGANSDLENVDLASVSEVINTANSPHFNQYLTEDMNCNILEKTATLTFSGNGDRESFHHSKSDIRRKSKENKYICDVCARTFQWESGLQRHIVKHTGCKPFICEACGTRCTTKSNLTRHRKNKHGEVEPPTTILWHNKRADSAIEMEEDSSESSFIGTCDPNRSPGQVNFASGSEISSDAKVPDSLECSYCNTSYKSDSDLFNHIKELHHFEYAKMQGQEVNLALSYWEEN